MGFVKGVRRLLAPTPFGEMWRGLQALRWQFRTFADLPSRRCYLQLRHGVLTQRADLPSIRLRPLGKNSVELRPGTTDANVLHDTFWGLYHLPPPDLHPRTILDLGSNIGLTIAHYAALYPEARILGVEMDPPNWRLCESNLAPYADRCRVLNGAVWIHDSSVSYGGDMESAFHVDETLAGPGSVPAYTIGRLIDLFGVDSIDFVKMDIEGAEKFVLADAKAWSARVDCLKVEIHPPYTMASCIQDLERAGFVCTPDDRHYASVVARRAERSHLTAASIHHANAYRCS
jgi:FkbM family methyltransferase